MDTLYKISVKNIAFKIVRIKCVREKGQYRAYKIRKQKKDMYAFTLYSGKAIIGIFEVITEMKNIFITNKFF